MYNYCSKIHIKVFSKLFAFLNVFVYYLYFFVSLTQVSIHFYKYSNHNSSMNNRTQ